MVQYLFRENILLYIYGALGILGLIIRLILDFVYKHLVKESDNVGTTKNNTIKHIKIKFETCYKLKIGVNNVDTFVNKYIIKHRFCGILLSTWENISGQVLVLLLLSIPVATVYGFIHECGQDDLLRVGAVGLLSVSLLIFVDKCISLSVKKYAIKLNLMDFFNNFLMVRLEQEMTNPELVEKYRREYVQAIEAGKKTIAATSTAALKDEPKDEINRRKESKRRKEEQRRLNALRREEELKKIEAVRREEEARRLEERKKLAEKRREERMLRLQQEREALEAKRAEERRKAREKIQEKERMEREKAEKEILFHGMVDESVTSGKVILDEEDKIDEMYDSKKIKKDKPSKTKKIEKIDEKEKPDNKENDYDISNYTNEQEEKIIEDVLKEFFGFG